LCRTFEVIRLGEGDKDTWWGCFSGQTKRPHLENVEVMLVLDVGFASPFRSKKSRNVEHVDGEVTKID
jgi:hypothetical protein